VDAKEAVAVDFSDSEILIAFGKNIAKEEVFL
jgi:hypothetical protein